ncbi:hypothetical protein V6256_15985, partial [Psychromonas aquatilis]
ELDQKTGVFFKAAEPKVHYKKCDNNARYNVCNSMGNLSTFVPDPNSEEILCFSCQFNEPVPALTSERHIP